MAIEKKMIISLTEQEDDFIKWMAERDNLSYAAELRLIFTTELFHQMELYLDEMKGEQEHE